MCHEVLSEESSYNLSDYYSWKTAVIKESIFSNPDILVSVIDDDRRLLEYLKKNISYAKLKVKHYDFFKDTFENIKEF